MRGKREAWDAQDAWEKDWKERCWDAQEKECKERWDAPKSEALGKVAHAAAGDRTGPTCARDASGKSLPTKMTYL